MKILSRSPQETIDFGARLAKHLFSGSVVALAGELGAGKTTMVKGLAGGLGVASTDSVTSPSFVIIKEYAARLPVYHFDLYRLNSLEEMEALGYEEYFYGQGVTIIEWAQKLKSLLPPVHLWIELRLKKEMTREIEVIARGKEYEKILKSLQTIKKL